MGSSADAFLFLGVDVGDQELPWDEPEEWYLRKTYQDFPSYRDWADYVKANCPFEVVHYGSGYWDSSTVIAQRGSVQRVDWEAPREVSSVPEPTPEFLAFLAKVFPDAGPPKVMIAAYYG